MGKRKSKEEEGIRLIAAMAMLLVGVWMFVPVLRPWIVLLAAITVVAALVAVVLKFRSIGLRPAVLQPPLMRTGPTTATMGDSVASPLPSPPPVGIQLTHAAVLAALRRIDWFQFEKVVAAIYRGYGDVVERIGGAHPDGGVDLVVTTKTGKFVVQCKHWRKWTVGVKEIRELLGTLTTSGIPKGVYVTMRGYSNDARDLGVKHGLVLLDEAQLAELIVGLGPTHGAEALAVLNDPRKFCPKCEHEMVLRTAKRGKNSGNQFWGCPNYPKCDGTLEAEAV